MTRKSLILRKNNQYELVLYESSQEETDEIISIMKGDEEKKKEHTILSELEMCGEASKVSEGFLKEYIPVYHIWSERKETHLGISKNKTEIIEYKCYANPNRNPYILTSNVVIHECQQSSFICACQTLNIQYFILLKKELNQEGKHKIETIFPDIIPSIEPIIKNEVPSQVEIIQVRTVVDLINSLTETKEENNNDDNVESIPKQE